MPIKIEKDKKKIPASLDNRRKLTPCEREAIKENIEGLSAGKLAEKYKVSRRLIQFILDPAKLEANKQAREKRGGWKQYYDTKEHSEAQRGTRAYRQSIINELI